MARTRGQSSRNVARSREAGRDRGKSAQVGNRERIVEASLKLFNERGTHNVTTNHIAAHLSISPGNLYYHFGNREEIVRAVYPQAEAAVREALPVRPGDRVSAADLGSYHLRGIETLWHFRFFFRDVDELLARDPLLAASFRELRGWLVGQFETLFECLIAQGHMHRPALGSDLPRIAANAFIVWTNWIGHLTLSRDTLDLDHADIVEGARHSFLTFAPYLEPKFAEEVRAVFDARSRKRRSAPSTKIRARTAKSGRS